LAAQAIGPEGGVVTHPSGASIVVPAGALASPVTLSIQNVTPEPESYLGAEPVGQAFVLGPEGQQFLRPVRVTVPFDATVVPVGIDLSSLQVFIAPRDSRDFVGLTTLLDSINMRLAVDTNHFSVVVPTAPLQTPVLITTTSPLPVGIVGTAYRAIQFEAVGGLGPYSWHLSFGALPEGLSLSADGALSGTPTQGGAFQMTVRVADSEAVRVDKPFEMNVTGGDNPVPVLALVSPSTASAGSAAMALTVEGIGFASTSSVLWNGTPLTTIFVSPTNLVAVATAHQLERAGSYSVTVTTPAPGGGTSSALGFEVTPAPNNPVPVITAINPTALPSGEGTPAQIHVVGTDFVESSQVVVDHGLDYQVLSTRYDSPTSLTAAVPAALLEVPGTLPIGVFNPAPGGGYSTTTIPLVVLGPNPTPTLLKLMPSSVPVGSPDQRIKVIGTNFVTGGKVYLGTVSLLTTVESSTIAYGEIRASRLTKSVVYDVSLVNPQPGGGTSNSLPFAVEPLDGGAAGDAATDAAPDAEQDGAGGSGGGPIDGSDDGAGGSGGGPIDASEDGTDGSGGSGGADGSAGSDAAVDGGPVDDSAAPDGEATDAGAADGGPDALDEGGA